MRGYHIHPSNAALIPQCLCPDSKHTLLELRYLEPLLCWTSIVLVSRTLEEFFLRLKQFLVRHAALLDLRLLTFAMLQRH